jgi:hypothetical protein
VSLRRDRLERNIPPGHLVLKKGRAGIHEDPASLAAVEGGVHPDPSAAAERDRSDDIISWSGDQRESEDFGQKYVV